MDTPVVLPVCVCVSLTDSHTEGQDDWWLLPTSWTGETLSADNEAKERGLHIHLTFHFNHTQWSGVYVCDFWQLQTMFMPRKCQWAEYNKVFYRRVQRGASYIQACIHNLTTDWTLTGSESFWCEFQKHKKVTTGKKSFIHKVYILALSRLSLNISIR